MPAHLALLICGLLGVQGSPQLNLEEVVRANEASVLAVHSLVVKVKSFQNNPRSTSPDALEETKEYTYRFQEGRGRKTTDEKQKRVKETEAGDRMGYSDISAGPEGATSIYGYDPSTPPKLGEYSLSKAYGFLEAPEPGPHPLGKGPFADLLLWVPEGGQSYPLRELIASATSARLATTPGTSTLGCYEIEVKRPLLDYRIYLDPAVNFMIRKIEIATPASNKDRVRGVTEASKFRDHGDGVFLPSVVDGSATAGDLPALKIHFELEVVSCNAEIPAKEFEVKFPDWLPVLDKRSGQIHRWGPDDKPRLTFATADEYHKWDTPRVEKAALMKRPWRIPWYVVMGAVTIVLMLALRIARRRTALAPA